MDENVRKSATLIGDTELLGRLSMGDMVALEAKYHINCLGNLYSKSRAAKHNVKTSTKTDDDQVAAIIFAELVMYIEEKHCEEGAAYIFKLSDLVKLYNNRMTDFACEHNIAHSTRLKDKLLAHFPSLQAHTKGREVLLVFREDVGPALVKAYEGDRDADAVVIARAARIIRSTMYNAEKGTQLPFSGSFSKTCQEDSVPILLLTLVNMVLEGPTITEQSTEHKSQSALSIAQLIRYNSVKHTRSHQVQSPRHTPTQETPVPVYIGLMIHAKTRKAELVDKFSHLGLCIPYNRVLDISKSMGDAALQNYRTEQVVYPLSLSEHIFTTAAVDNIDHNPSSTTSKASFHGTGISLMQHPVSNDDITHHNIAIHRNVDKSKTVGHLPHYYTDVKPVACKNKGLPIPPTTVTSINRSNVGNKKIEYEWLNHTKNVLESGEQTPENVSWAAYHANRQAKTEQIITPTALLPLFNHNAHSIAMIRHSMDVIKSAVHHLNPGQTPVLVFDQPLYAIAKQIQWKWTEKYGEDQFVIVFGGLHIELVALKTAGDWLKGSGWIQALVKSKIATDGTAESFLHVSHIARTRDAHQITAAALYILQDRAYNNYRQASTDVPLLTYDDWIAMRCNSSPQFRYWSTVLSLQLAILVFIRSLREGSFTVYLDALTELTHWFFAMDHTHYARWISVHLRDMADLPSKHPDVYRNFMDGHFVVKKTHRLFSSIVLDQAHEQNNAKIKGDGGAVGLTDNPAALRRWMVSGPEVSRVVGEFEEALQNVGNKKETLHHDQRNFIQKEFAKDVRLLVDALEEMGSPFEEDGTDLLVLHTKEIVDKAAVANMRNVPKIGQEQFTMFTKERFVERSKLVEDTIHRNTMAPFKTSKHKSTIKGKKMASLKKEVELFSRLYISCQTRRGDLYDFFKHENQTCPPSLSKDGELHFGNKSDLLSELENLCDTEIHQPPASALILDGAAIVHLLNPGTVNTFEEYSNEVFLPYITSQLQNVSRIDLVWDTYRENSLKSTTREKRGSGIKQKVVGNAQIPRNWNNFLTVDTNKTELFAYLTNETHKLLDVDTKELFVTDGENVLTVPTQTNLSSLAPCTHEESDTRMMLHAAHATNNGHSKILVRTVDTDVLVLCVMVVSTLPPDTELWLAFGTGKHFRYIPAHKIAASLGPEKSCALPMFHAMTGCDTVSSFTGHGKVTAWSTWNSFPELTEALVAVASAPPAIPPDVMSTIERFVILMYDRTSKTTDIDIARKKLFPKRNSSVQRIPPSKAALVQHTKRAMLQGAHIWGQTLIAAPHIPSPTYWGWLQTEDGHYEPLWTTLSESSQSCQDLLTYCGCKKGCKGKSRCKCRVANTLCTALCACDGECREVEDVIIADV